MIKLTFDRFDFLYALDGFAHSGWRRQYVWKDVV